MWSYVKTTSESSRCLFKIFWLGMKFRRFIMQAFNTGLIDLIKKKNKFFHSISRMAKSALSIQFLSWEKGRNNEVMNFWFLSGLFFCNLRRSRVHLSPRIQLIVVQKSFISKIMVQNFERGDLRSNLSRFDVSDSFHGSSFSLHTKFERLLSKKFWDTQL